MTTIFVDCETLGLERHHPIWEFAALRMEDDGTESVRESDKLSAACGINPDDYARHTAMGDVLWCRDWYNRMLGSEGAVW